jgi:TatD DNase family protein
VIDAHAHLADPKLAHDLEDVLARATAAGLTRVLSCGEDVTSSRRTLQIAERHSSVRVAAGVHPHRAAAWTDAVADQLRELAREELVVAIGEIGVDLSGRSAPQAAQETAFAAQLALARELALPVVVHVRDAGFLAREIVDRVLSDSNAARDAGAIRGMIHCFSEGPAEVEEWARRGFVISFAGTVTYPKNVLLREAAARVPPDRILVETDAPYLAPQRRRGVRNEPAFVAETLAAVALARGEAVETLAAAMAATARGLFGARWD